MANPTLSLNTTDIGMFNVTKRDNSTKIFTSDDLLVVYFSLVIAFLGSVGNGLVFWYLLFRIQKTPFTVYVVNLAIADLLMLLSSIVVLLHIVCGLWMQLKMKLIITGIFLTVAYYASLFILTAISVERCLSLSYPFWYRCKRPKYQSGITCAGLWTVSMLLTYIDYFGCNDDDYKMAARKCTVMTLSTSSLSLLIFSPAMVLSSLVLFFKVWTRTWRQHTSKLYIIIVVSVIIFILFTVPPRILSLLNYFQIVHGSFFIIYTWSLFCSVVNSAANPFVYFFVGKMGKQGIKGSIRGVLQKVFKEDSDISQEVPEDMEASEIRK